MQMFFVENTAGILMVATAVLVTLVVWMLIVSVQLYRLHKRYRKAMSFGEDLDVEESLGQQAERLQHNSESLQVLVRRVDDHENLLSRTLHRVGVIRFNPFPDAGGDLSFSVALLDASDNGVVISSLHAREGTRVYAKPIVQGSSKHTLSGEEQQAIAQARRQ